MYVPIIRQFVKKKVVVDGSRKTEGRKENRRDRKEFDILAFLPKASVLEESSKALKEYMGLMVARIGEMGSSLLLTLSPVKPTGSPTKY